MALGTRMASDWLVLTPDIVFLPCFCGIRLWIWPEPLVAPRVRRALGTRMARGKQKSDSDDLDPTLDPVPQQCVRKTFSASFVPQPAENNTSLVLVYKQRSVLPMYLLLHPGQVNS